jgi:hypothetical protein
MPALGARLMRGFSKHDPHQDSLAAFPKALLAAMPMQRGLQDRRLPPSALPCLRTIGQRALPTKLTVGKEACAAIERAERLMAQLAVIGFRAELDAHGALSFVNAKPERRDFARMCPAAHCFAVVNEALDIDPGFVAVAVRRPSKKQGIARAGRDRFLADGWAEKARSLGWSERELFALPERWSPIDHCGVAWLVGERRVIGATADAIAIETEFGARLRFYRRGP